MKKAIVYLLIGTMLLSITACGKKSDNANGTEQATVTEGANEYGTVDLCTRRKERLRHCQVKERGDSYNGSNKKGL